jgi:hypothetical protein
LTVMSIIGSLDTILVCFTSAPWIVVASGSAILVLALIDGLTIGMLLGLQAALLWRIRGKPRTKTVIATAKLKSNPRRRSPSDRELAG